MQESYLSNHLQDSASSVLRLLSKEKEVKQSAEQQDSEIIDMDSSSDPSVGDEGKSVA